ncbi:MAG: PD-(D/E)XK nuclease family protein [Acidobacteriota bacterium]
MPVYSYSKLDLFEKCPHQFKLRYIDKIERRIEPVEILLGRTFHKTMEFLYKNLKIKIFTLDELINYFRGQWKSNFHEEIFVIKKEWSVEDYKKIGERCIEDYYRRYYPFDSSRVLSLERSIEIPLDDRGMYKIFGVIDRISQSEDGIYEIHDYKTSTTLPTQKDLDKDKQLGLYQIGVQKMWRDAQRIKLIWHFVYFDKEFSSERGEDQLKDLIRNTIALIKKVEREVRFEPHESELCEWCVYQDLCPRRKHFFIVENLTEDEYLEDDGVKLVNQYVKLKEEIDDLKIQTEKIENEMERLKDLILKYAEKEGLDVVRGDQFKATISKRVNVSYDFKNEKEREELETLIREANKWNEVCKLSFPEMRRIVTEEVWGPELTEKIKKYFKIEKLKSINLSRLKED